MTPDEQWLARCVTGTLTDNDKKQRRDAERVELKRIRALIAAHKRLVDDPRQPETCKAHFRNEIAMNTAYLKRVSNR